MMKKYLSIILILLISIKSIGQKITKNELDKFTNYKRIETDKVAIYGSNMSFTPNKIMISYRSADKSNFIKFIGYNTAAGVIGKDDEIILLLEDGKKVILKSTGIQSYDLIGTPSVKSYSHQYSIENGDIEILSKQKVKSIRIFYDNQYEDIDIKDSLSKNILDLSKVFLNEISKN